LIICFHEITSFRFIVFVLFSVKQRVFGTKKRDGFIRLSL